MGDDGPRSNLVMEDMDSHAGGGGGVIMLYSSALFLPMKRDRNRRCWDVNKLPSCKQVMDRTE
jgi:hypothetical protein